MWSMIGMGFVITLLILFNELFLFSLFIKVTFRWVILLWTIWSIIFLSSGIFMYYNFLGNWHDFKLSSYLEFIGNIGSMSIIPITGIYFYLRIKGLKETLNQEYKSPDQDQQSAIVSIVAENGKDKLTLPFSNLIYLEAEDNYVAIHHLEDQNLVKTLIRKSLRSIQEQGVHPQLYRCHRSFMINLQHLQHLKGNKNKLNVQIAHVDKPIVVSRQYIDELLLMTSKQSSLPSATNSKISPQSILSKQRIWFKRDHISKKTQNYEVINCLSKPD